MAVKHYHKLVRDLIPAIICAGGGNCTTRTLTDEEYLAMLDKKLWEEMQEYQESKSLEELADLLEVIRAVATARGASWEELECIRVTKAAARGGFAQKVFLETVWEGEESHD